MKTLIKILCLSVLWFSCESSTEPEPDVYGCTDETACNFNPDATIYVPDSCQYIIDDCGECGGNNENLDCSGNCNGEYVELWGECFSVQNTTVLDYFTFGCQLDTFQTLGEIPPNIGKLINLTSLDLSGCGINGEIPLEIGQLINLETIDLDYNNLTGSIPNQIGQLVQLKELDFDYNQLTSIPESFSNLINIVDLDLDQNEFNHELSYLINIFLNFDSLVELSLNHNNLIGEIPYNIGSFTSLTKLRLNNNQLVGEIPSSIGNLVNLEFLNLNNNQLVGEIPESICNQGDSSPNVGDNQLCPPYPECISQGDIDSQDTSNCP